MNIKGIVLAGGKSLRFGDDKSLARFGGQTLIERSVSVLRELHLDPVALTNRQRDYSFLNCRIEYDILPHLGPLGGLYTACKLFPKNVLFVITCDMPALQSSTLQTLLSRHKRHDQITVFALHRGEYQPFPGIYPAGMADFVYAELMQMQFSMQRFLETAPHPVVELPPPNGFQEFNNVNTKADLEDLSLPFILRN